MKHRLTALVALAAAVAIPAVASAATMHKADPSATASGNTMVIVPSNGDAAQALFTADHTYLTSLCPDVLSHPGNYTGAYKQFCQTG